MAYPLTANPNKHYYTTRNGRILGIVLHVTAGLEDFTPPDNGAEATVKYGQSNVRAASWHGICDSDSVIDCLPDSYTAFHVVGYNSRSLGLEIANRDAVWTGKPAPWVDATLRNAAAWCRPRVARYGLPLQLATKAQVDAAVRVGRPFGFSYHYYLNPGTRIDPGKGFPWAKFAALVETSAASAGAATAVEAPGVKIMGDSRFTVDGLADAGTVKMWQRIWGTPVTSRWDGPTVAGMQRWLGVADDGVWGPQTRRALYARIGYQGSDDWTLYPGPSEQTRALEHVFNSEADVLAEKPTYLVEAVKAPTWPLPQSHRLGPNPTRRVTWHDGTDGDVKGATAIKQWQVRMSVRGWDLGSAGADGIAGPTFMRVAAGFAKQTGIAESGVGPLLWAAAWERPVI